MTEIARHSDAPHRHSPSCRCDPTLVAASGGPAVDPPGPYVVTALSLTGLRADQIPADPALHPERCPVGPFPDRETADRWAYGQTALYGGGSWSLAPLRRPR